MIGEIVNTVFGKNFNIYRGGVVKDSVVEDQCTVGDFSRVFESKLFDQVRIDRNNFILKSEIGALSYTGQFTTILHSEIGKFCSISWGVTIGGGEHDYNKLTTHDFIYNKRYGFVDEELYNRYSAPVVIGNDVWIGANSTICRGVYIGDGAVIGANSIVTKNVPPYAIVAGCPAKLIKYRFSKNIIDELLDIKWWNLPLGFIKKNVQIFAQNDISNVIELIKKEAGK